LIVGIATNFFNFILGGNLYSKDQQLKKVKEKKVSNFGKKRSCLKKRSVKNQINKDEKDYLDWLQNQYYGCFVCGQQNGIEWHHVKKFSSDKKNHFRLIPLCGVEHHRLGKLSPHGSPKFWRETYTYEEQLLYAASIHLNYLNKG